LLIIGIVCYCIDVCLFALLVVVYRNPIGVYLFLVALYKGGEVTQERRRGSQHRDNFFRILFVLFLLVLLLRKEYSGVLRSAKCPFLLVGRSMDCVWLDQTVSFTFTIFYRCSMTFAAFRF
jgi:hypothetical protein